MSQSGKKGGRKYQEDVTKGLKVIMDGMSQFLWEK
jgi:hypothetical protein